MSSLFDICEIFVDENTLNSLFEKISETIEDEDEGIVVDTRSRLHHKFSRDNLITSCDIKKNKITVFRSAYQYFAGVKVIKLGRPDLVNEVRTSNKPFEVSHVPLEDYIANAEKWEANKVDAAFKANWLKYASNQDLADELLATGYTYLTFETPAPWGEEDADDEEWCNFSGKILMIIREELRRTKLSSPDSSQTKV